MAVLEAGLAKRFGMLLVAAATALAMASSATAQQGAAAEIRVWRGDEPAQGFGFWTLGEGVFETATLSDPKAQEGADILDANLNAVMDRLAQSGFFALDDGQGIPDVLWVQPVRSLDSENAYPLAGGWFAPPVNTSTYASLPVVDVAWLAAMAAGAARPSGPQGFTYAWRDPMTTTAYMVANQAVLKMAIELIGRKYLDPKTPRLPVDSVGSTVFNGMVFALTKYGASVTQNNGHPAGTASPNDYQYAFDLDASFGETPLHEGGWTPQGLLALGKDWSLPWAGLEVREGQERNSSSEVITGVMSSVLANGGPEAVQEMFKRRWPLKGFSAISATAIDWIIWLDGGILSTGINLKVWENHTKFIPERGFTGGYITALADVIGLARRVEEEGGGKPLPRLFADGLYLRAMFYQHPCQEFSFSLNAPVSEVTLEIPPVASRCIRVKWDGEGVGPDSVTPPISLALQGEGMDEQDYRSLLLASSQGERTGLVVESASGTDMAKFWSLPFEPDHTGSKWMTLAIANSAPRAHESKARTVRLTFGTGLTSGSGTASVVADARPPGDNGECRPRTVSMPAIQGSMPVPVIFSGSESTLDGLTGMSVLTRGSPRSDAAIRMGLCAAQVQAFALDAGSEVALGLQRDGDGQNKAACMQTLPAAAQAMSVEPRQVEVVGLSLSPAPEASNDPGAMSIPVEAELELFDPGLKAARRHPTAGYGGDVALSLKGVVTFQIRSATRLRGRIDLKVPAGTQGECPNSEASGSLTFVFDMVAAVPLDEDARVLPPDVLEVMEPMVWALMSPAQRAQALEAAAEARREIDASRADGAGGTVLGGGGACDCSCEEFSDAGRRDACALQCGDFQPIAPKCVMDREVARGQSRAAVEERIGACPSDCASLAGADPLCREAFPLLSKACVADTVTEADKACYLALLVKDMPEPMRSQIQTQMRDELANMDQDTLKMIVRPQLDSMKEQGGTCPAN